MDNEDLDLDGLLDDVRDAIEDTQNGDQSKSNQSVQIVNRPKKQEKTKSDASVVVEGLIDNFTDIKKQLLKNLEEDRADIDKYIKRFSRRIAKKDEVKQYYVEALTTLLSTKAGTSMNTIKVLDSIAKILAATKNHNALNNDNDSMDLSDLLSNVSEEADESFDPDNP